VRKRENYEYVREREEEKREECKGAKENSYVVFI
jgi:hypothetical protein